MSDEQSLDDILASTYDSVSAAEDSTEVNSNEVAEETQEDSPVGEESPAEAPVAAKEGYDPANWEQLPASWKKDLKGYWGQLPRNVREYIYEREKQALDGITQYKTQLEPWEKTMDPYKNVFQTYNLTPQDAFRRLMDAELVLRHGSPDQKRAMFNDIVNSYGLAEFMPTAVAQEQQAGSIPREYSDRIARLEASLAEQTQASANKHVADFMNSADNKYAQEVRTDMADLIKANPALSLKDAYERAIWLNPSVRQKLMAEEIAKAATPQKAPLTNVKSSPVAAKPTASKAKTLDEVLNEAFDRITSS